MDDKQFETLINTLNNNHKQVIHNLVAMMGWIEATCARTGDTRDKLSEIKTALDAMKDETNKNLEEIALRVDTN